MFPGHTYGMELDNPDLAALGAAYGALGIKVSRDDEFLPALKQALAADRSSLIEVMTDPEFATPTVTLSELSGKPLQGD
jgi:acetolactate synthase-1/2/3 large subunit